MRRELPDELKFLTLRNTPQKNTTAILKDQVIVLTGATSGVGLAALKRLITTDNRIFIVVRNLAKATALLENLGSFQARIEIVVADMSRLAEVRSAAGTILEKTDRVDILINCAGLHSTKRTLTSEGFETVFAVNHLAAFLLTELLMEALKRSGQGRILLVNSEGHRFNGLDLNDLNWKKRHYTGLRGYGASKTAQLLCMIEWDKQLKNSSVTINAMHPGDVRTAIGQNNGWLYRTFSKWVIQPLLKDPVISGEAIYTLIAELELAKVRGRYFYLTLETKPSPHATDPDKAALIYRKSRELCGLV